MGDGDEVFGLRDLDDVRQILVVDQAVVQVIDVKIALEGGGIEALAVGPNVVTPLRVAAIAKRLRLPIGVDLAVHNFQRIPRGAYALLHVVFLFVDRAVRICGEVEDDGIALFGLGFSLYAGEDLPLVLVDNPISEVQSAKLKKLLEQTDSDVKKFCQVFKCKTVDELSLSQYDRALSMLEKKLASA